MYHREWTEAAGHAQLEIASNGNWSCPCKSCVAMRDKIFRAVQVGRCIICGNPVKNRRSSYCGVACKQQAYRWRKQKA